MKQFWLGHQQDGGAIYYIATKERATEIESARTSSWSDTVSGPYVLLSEAEDYSADRYNEGYNDGYTEACDNYNDD